MTQRIKQLLETDMTCTEIVEMIVSEKFTLSPTHEQDYRDFIQQQMDKALIELA